MASVLQEANPRKLVSAYASVIVHVGSDNKIATDRVA